MDLIAGLPGESYEMFCDSVKKAGSPKMPTHAAQDESIPLNSPPTHMTTRETAASITSLARYKIARYPPMEIAKGNSDKADMFWRDGHLARNDGNSVDLDVETSEMGKNSVMYQALTSALRRHKGIFSYALDSGKNL